MFFLSTPFLFISPLFTFLTKLHLLFFSWHEPLPVFWSAQISADLWLPSRSKKLNPNIIYNLFVPIAYFWKVVTIKKSFSEQRNSTHSSALPPSAEVRRMAPVSNKEPQQHRHSSYPSIKSRTCVNTGKEPLSLLAHRKQSSFPSSHWILPSHLSTQQTQA